jgi:hypothetical protein
METSLLKLKFSISTYKKGEEEGGDDSDHSNGGHENKNVWKWAGFYL